jgi:AbiJ N-terminal domain 3/AAA domain, putative AbiEii toxin, Type IV TA system
MLKISKKLKLEIFKEVISQPNPFAETEEEGILIFLKKIWDLESMPSEDSRRENALGDIIQHTLANFDWEFEYLFLERLKLLEEDVHFELFVEALLSPDIRSDENDITNYYFLVNPYLEKEGFTLTISEYNDDNFPIYKIITVEEQGNLPIDLVENTIPFIVLKNVVGWTQKIETHEPPEVFPSFVLVFNNGWNDFGYRTDYDLFFYDENSEVTYIGSTKIMKSDDEADDSPLADNFKELDNDFCSLGQTIEYYSNLKHLFDKKFTSILYALKDVAFFPEINDKFENKTVFNKSLIRYDEAERLLREAKYLVYGYDLSNLYSFTYDFKPKFSDTPIKVNFDFNNNTNSTDRIYGLIGKNATGKTQLITSLPIDIAKNKNELFTPKTPLFSKVIAVSYSIFDSFELPKSTVSFNYKYCGLKDSDGNLISDKGLILRFHHTWKKIKELERMNDWKEILLNFMEEDLLDTFIVQKEGEETLTVNIEEFTKVRKAMSSGQNILLYVISEIVANIRFDSLILYDEPETHLHPNAISQLVNAIYELINKFESYCILATHSPLIIRELLSKNVLVIEREGNVASIRKIGIESFGENLTILTDEVFGNRSIPKQHKLIIEKLVSDGKSYDEIVLLLESDGLPLSLNALMTIKSLTNEKPYTLQ